MSFLPNAIAAIFFAHDPLWLSLKPPASRVDGALLMDKRCGPNGSSPPAFSSSGKSTWRLKLFFISHNPWKRAAPKFVRVPTYPFEQAWVFINFY
jgi:hypothetical protein